ncbi:alpha/beta fold hydrolase [Actinomadura sp. HBU206391]|uniref:alpha/beta fold hydrolase n=1 Tax=Actinomadura sp. HBU206391 TaxID=2731692 RepID=UPI001C9D273B|nr:alpha/beta hydrolase [Actinomadura sp. HBU206391]
MTITDHEISLAVRDFGGPGEPVLLLHGLGGTLEAWDALELKDHRAVAMDLRGHGLSGDGSWEWERVLDDIEVVVKHFDLGNPAIVGHSLGGMLAVLWARRHPECPGIINLDGLRSAENDTGNYPGMDPIARDQELAELKATFDAQAASMGRPLPAEFQAMFPTRALIEKDGETYARPGAELLEAVRYTPEFRDAIPLLRQVTCAALVLIPTQDPPGMSGGELMKAFRRGVRRDLADMPSNVQVKELDAGHNMLGEQPKVVAELVTDFLTANGPGSAPSA